MFVWSSGPSVGVGPFDWRKVVGDGSLLPVVSTLTKDCLQLYGQAKIVPADGQLRQITASVGVQFVTSPHDAQRVTVRLLRLPVVGSNGPVTTPPGQIDFDALQIAALVFDFGSELATWQDEGAGYKNVWQRTQTLALAVPLSSGDQLLLLTEHDNVSLAALQVSAAAL